MGTIDNVYIVNYLINRQIRKKGGKLVGLFVDLKAAFDSVERGELMRAMRESGVREGLVERVEEILRETKSRVRVGGQLGGILDGKGCETDNVGSLSPTLFNLLIADLEEMAKVKWGGVKLGENLYTVIRR